MATATKKPTATTCGSIYRMRTVTGSRHTENGTWQARRTACATEFEPEYAAAPDEVAQAVRRGSFTTKP